MTIQTKINVIDANRVKRERAAGLRQEAYVISNKAIMTEVDYARIRQLNEQARIIEADLPEVIARKIDLDECERVRVAADNVAKAKQHKTQIDSIHTQLVSVTASFDRISADGLLEAQRKINDALIAIEDFQTQVAA